MIKIELRGNSSLHIEGYVNAVERDSKPLVVPSIGKCVEQVGAGVFGEAVRAADNIYILENHDPQRRLGSIADGNLTLYEDPIGLRASADITDPDIISKARSGEIKGWSFGFVATASEIENRAGDIPRRHIKGMRLTEVSLIDGRFSPCYAGTSVEVRSDGELIEFRTEEVQTPADLSYYRNKIKYLELVRQG